MKNNMSKKIDFETTIRNEYQKRWSKPKRIHRNGDNLVLGWHFGYYEKGFRSYKKAITNMNNYVGRLLEINDNNRRILDAGCGVGATIMHLAKKHQNSTFYGITLSSNEVMLAEELKRKYNLKNTNFYQKSYNLTDFPNEYFDDIYALESAIYAKDKSIFLREMNRILKKDGKLVIIDMFRQYDLTNQFCKNIRNKIIREKNPNNAKMTIYKLKEFLMNEGFGNTHIRDLIKSRNVKFSHLYFFIFQYLFWNMVHQNLEKIGQKSHKPLFFSLRFFYYFLFRYLLVLISRYRYFSIVAIKNKKKEDIYY